MGITGYYRRFIKVFSKLAHPITLQNKCTNFEWIWKCRDRFEKLKRLSTTIAILKLGEPNKGFVVLTNVGKEGLGDVLMYQGHLISYRSKKLKDN